MKLPTQPKKEGKQPNAREQTSNQCNTPVSLVNVKTRIVFLFSPITHFEIFGCCGPFFRHFLRTLFRYQLDR